MCDEMAQAHMYTGMFVAHTDPHEVILYHICISTPVGAAVVGTAVVGVSVVGSIVDGAVVTVFAKRMQVYAHPLT